MDIDALNNWLSEQLNVDSIYQMTGDNIDSLGKKKVAEIHELFKLMMQLRSCRGGAYDQKIVNKLLEKHGVEKNGSSNYKGFEKVLYAEQAMLVVASCKKSAALDRLKVQMDSVINSELLKTLATYARHHGYQFIFDKKTIKHLDVEKDITIELKRILQNNFDLEKAKAELYPELLRLSTACLACVFQPIKGNVEDWKKIVENQHHIAKCGFQNFDLGF